MYYITYTLLRARRKYSEQAHFDTLQTKKGGEIRSGAKKLPAAT